MIRTFLATLLFAAAATAQVVDTVTPSIGAFGTLVTIEGSGFGDAKPKVVLVSEADGKTRKLKVHEWSDTHIVAEIRKQPAGPHELAVLPKGAAGEPAIAAAPLEVALPSDASFVPDTAGPGEEVTLIAQHLGTKKGVVKVGGKKAKVLSWQIAPGNGEALGTVVFKLHKKTPAGGQSVTVKTSAGEVVLEQGLDVTEPDPGGGGGGIEGNPYSSTAPGLQFVLDGGPSPIVLGSPYKDFLNQGTTTHKVWVQSQAFQKIEIYIDYFSNAPSSPDKTKTLLQPEVHIVYSTLGGVWTTTNNPAVGDVLPGSFATVTVTGQVQSFFGPSFGGAFSGTLVKVLGSGPDTITITDGFFWTIFSPG